MEPSDRARVPDRLAPNTQQPSHTSAPRRKPDTAGPSGHGKRGRHAAKTNGAKFVALIVVAAATLVLGSAVISIPPTIARAEATASPEPEIVEIGIVTTPAPSPIPAPTPEPITITEHELNDGDVERLARLAFLSPLYDRTYKAALMWVVLNRVDSETFPNTIQLVIEQSGEFTIWDPNKYIKPENLEANMELARLVLNQWLSEKEGHNAGRPIPKDALFTVFTGDLNRNLELLAERGGTALYYPIRGAYDY